jgi:hypothetical protein
LWQNGSTDVCVKVNAVFSEKEKDLQSLQKTEWLLEEGEEVPEKNWDSTHTKWISQDAKIRVFQRYIIPYVLESNAHPNLICTQFLATS